MWIDRRWEWLYLHSFERAKFNVFPVLLTSVEGDFTETEVFVPDLITLKSLYSFYSLKNCLSIILYPNYSMIWDVHILNNSF